MADKESEWNVPSSDGEEDSGEAAQSQGEEKWEVPLNVLLLYSEIEKNGFIELKVKECRSGENSISSEIKEQENVKDENPNEDEPNTKTIGNDETLAPSTEKEK